MLVHPRRLLVAAVAFGLCAGPAAAQDSTSAPAAETAPAPPRTDAPPDAAPDVAPQADAPPAPAPAAAPGPEGEFGSGRTSIPPIRQLEPEPVPAVEPPQQENVWSQGVPESERQAAEALFLEGNKLLRESITLLAVSKYREALTHWDHPNIHFNLAIALMSMDQPVETYEHLQQATRHGAKPLEEERYQHAKNYLVLLEKQLARVQLRCDVPEGFVELDGQQLFPTPGEWSGLLRAGRHTLVARRDGYVTNQSVRVLEGGQTVRIQLQLMTLGELTETTRRWSAWKPWVVVGVGAAGIAAGVTLTASGNRAIGEYDREASRICGSPVFCTENAHPEQLARLDRMLKDARRRQTMGVAGYAAGGAVFVTGAVFAYLNRGRSHVRTYEEVETAAPPPAVPPVEVSPLVTPDAPGLMVRVRF